MEITVSEANKHDRNNTVNKRETDVQRNNRKMTAPDMSYIYDKYKEQHKASVQ